MFLYQNSPVTLLSSQKWHQYFHIWLINKWCHFKWHISHDGNWENVIACWELCCML